MCKVGEIILMHPKCVIILVQTNCQFNIYFRVRFNFGYHKFLKRTFKAVLKVQNNLLKLYSSVKNSKRLLSSQKAGVKCAY